MKRSLAVLTLCAGAAAALSCEPCAGVASCVGDAHISLSGRIVEESTGRGASGVILDMIRVGGVGLASESLRVVTDGEGLFAFEVAASEVGEVIVDISVRHPAGAYRVERLTVGTTRRRGEGRVLPTWSTQPRLPDLGMVYRRGHPHIPLANVEVEFRRTGGMEVSGLENGVYRTTTGADGWFELFGSRIEPTSAEDLIGDLIIHAPEPVGDYTHRDVRIGGRIEFRAPAALRTFGVGPNIEYHFAAMYRGRYGVMVPGVRIEFRRTGGIRLTEETWTATTDGSGRVVFPGQALDYGTLTGVLKITPPPPAKEYERLLELEAYDEDGATLWGVLGIGPGLPYYLILRRNGTRIAGVEVEFRRTGGINVHPDRIVTVTDDSGMVNITPGPKSEGELFADIIVRPPAPFASFTVPVRMMALDAEVPGGRVLLGDWDVAAPPASVRSDQSP